MLNPNIDRALHCTPQNRRLAKGFTLVELMIALTINMLLFAGLIGAVIANLHHYNRSLLANRLNQQLQASMDLMTREIRRAGYWANARSDVGTHQNNNPFMATGADLTIGGTGNSCILFTYDHDKDGSLPAVSSSIDDERYGFRLDNGVLQARPPGAAFSCTAASTAWENVTDTKNIVITTLTFTPQNFTFTTGPGTRGILLRSVDITLTGHLTIDSTITKTVTQHVRIRNDKYIP